MLLGLRRVGLNQALKDPQDPKPLPWSSEIGFRVSGLGLSAREFSLPPTPFMGGLGPFVHS